MDLGFNGINSLGYSAKDIQILAKYGVGATLIEPDEGPLSGANLPFFALMGAQQAFPWFKQNRSGVVKDAEGVVVKGTNWFQNWGQALKNLNEQKEGTESMKAIRGAAGINETAESYKEGYKALMSGAAYGKGLTSFRLSKITESLPEIEKLDKLPEIKARGTELHRIITEAVKNKDLATAEKNLAELNKLTHGKVNGICGKFGNWVGRHTGFSAISGWFKKTAAEGSPLLQKVLPCVKGAGIWAAISGVTELCNIVPAFTQGGIGSGLAQIGKSTVKTAASVGGWFGGEALGASAGAVIGTALCPVIGTAAGAVIGGLVGIVGGFIGSWGAGKIAQKIVGKDEPELIKERQAKQLAQQAMVDPATLQGIFGKVNERLQSEGDSLDTRVAFKSLQNLGISVDPSQQTQVANATAQPQQTAPSFQGNPYQMAYNYSNVNPLTELMLQGSINTSTDPFDMAVSNAMKLKPGFSAQA